MDFIIKLDREKVQKNLLLNTAEEKMNESSGLQYVFKREFACVEDMLKEYTDNGNIKISFTYHKDKGDILLRGRVMHKAGSWSKKEVA